VAEKRGFCSVGKNKPREKKEKKQIQKIESAIQKKEKGENAVPGANESGAL